MHQHHSFTNHAAADAFIAFWDIWWFLTAFGAETALESTIEVFEPDITHERVVVHWSITVVLFCISVMLGFFEYKLVEQVKHRLASSSSPTPKRIVKDSTAGELMQTFSSDQAGASSHTLDEADMSQLSVDPVTGDLKAPIMQFKETTFIASKKMIWLFTALSANKSAQDTIVLWMPDPTAERAAVYWSLSFLMMALYLSGSYLVPRAVAECKRIKIAERLQHGHKRSNENNEEARPLVPSRRTKRPRQQHKSVQMTTSSPNYDHLKEVFSHKPDTLRGYS